METKFTNYLNATQENLIEIENIYKYIYIENYKVIRVFNFSAELKQISYFKLYLTEHKFNNF